MPSSSGSEQSRKTGRFYSTVKALRFTEPSASICGSARRNIGDDVNLHLNVCCVPVSKKLSSEKSET